MSSLSDKRQSGRTTRMMQEAIRLADEGRAVYVVLNSPMDAEHIKRRIMRNLLGHEGRTLGIKFESIDELNGFDWHHMRLPRSHPNCVWLVDHYVIERRFQKMLAALVQFDRKEGA